MQKYQNALLNRNGDGIPNASVLVKDTAGTVVAIYSTAEYGELSNPFTTDILGNFSFYAANGRYNLTFSKDGTVIGTETDVLLYDPEDPGPTVPTALLASEDGASLVGYKTASESEDTTTVKAQLRKYDAKLYVSVTDFGAVGNNSHDDTSAFQALGEYLRSKGGGKAVLPPGDYLISDPFWAYGIDNWELEGYGATIRNTSTSSSAFQKTTFQLNLPAEAGGTPSIWDSGDYGTLIATTERGAQSVTCLTPSEASKFSVGKIYKITSRCIQQGGWPFNHAYFDFVTVTETNASTGVVTFLEPLKNRHRADDIDVPYPTANWYPGAARIWSGNEEKGTFFSSGFVCRGIKFLVSPTYSNTGSAFYGVNRLLLEDCEFNYMYLGECNTISVRNCKIKMFEPDKHIGTLSVENCVIGQISQATGIYNLTISGCVIDRVSTFGPRQLTMNDNFIFDKSASGSGTPLSIVKIIDNIGTKSVILRGNTFTSCKSWTTSTDKVGAVQSAVGSKPILPADYTIDGNTIKISKSVTNIKNDFLRACVEDTYISFSGTTAVARINSVYDDGTYYCVDVTITGDITGHTGIVSGRTVYLESKNNRYCNCDFQALPALKPIIGNIENQLTPNSYTVIHNTGLKRTNSSNTTEGSAYAALTTNVYEIEVNVIRPYTGVSPALWLYVSSLNKYINLLEYGKRRYNETGSYGTKTGDDTGTFDPKYITNCSLSVNTSKTPFMGDAPTDTVDKQAIFSVTFYFDPVSLLTTEY